MLIEHDEIVEEPHCGTQRRVGHFFVQRQARRTVEMIHFENAAGLLREGFAPARDQGQQSGSHHSYS